MADILSQVTTQLDSEMVKSILDGVALGTVHQVETHDPAIMEGDQCLEQEVRVTAGHPVVEMHVTDWAKAQRGPSVKCSAGLPECVETDQFEDSSGRPHLQ